ncbi:autotransporter beta-domain protein [Chlamydia ibidis]|uniref:Autotransporter beta-domain protein n=2 Tax=Chlamydia ibidis TaxID=1405396 RepID=S7KJX3_9CHLA|nr:autotransporter domain-containing protein [Chlamydia ibidis]EPP34715.1 autotransporter beta-domain protein [Chlamydia ibidis]EQM62457.1 autotransporter beta-domain protein [Chlamydia ibidis 10-1398/6]
MITKKENKLQNSTFSRSVMFSILVGIGVSSHICGFGGSELVSESSPYAFSSPKAGFFYDKKKKDTESIVPKDIKDKKEVCDLSNSFVLKENNSCQIEIVSQGGVGSSSDLSGYQSLVHRTTLFQILGKLLWKDIDAAHVMNLDENLLGKKYPSIQKGEQGLAFCYIPKDDPKKNESSSCFVGVALWGGEPNAELSFQNLSTSQSGSAVYSSSGVFFENFKKGLSFENCTSGKSGGAIAGADITIRECSNLNFSGSKTNLALEKVSQEDFSQGGGAIVGVCSIAENAKDVLSGSVKIIGNIGENTFQGNHADKANGGAISAENVSLSSNLGSLLFKSNQALSGGAISSRMISIAENTATIEFSKNSSLLDFDPGMFVGGGALAARGIISLRNNSDMHFLNNSSQGCGGAILCKDIVISEQVGEQTFKENTSQSYGGAVCANNSATIKDNFGSILFKDNKSSLGGGAIYSGDLSKDVRSDDDHSGVVELVGNSGTISFIKNAYTSIPSPTADEDIVFGGGAIFGRSIAITRNTGITSLEGNTATSYNCVNVLGGGGICGSDNVTIANNFGTVRFTYNKLELSPEACVRNSAEEEISLDKSDADLLHSSVNACTPKTEPTPVTHPSSNELSEQRQSTLGTVISGTYGGGAIFSKNVDISGNMGKVYFSDNSVILVEGIKNNCLSSGGGALYGSNNVKISDNKDIAFTNNYASGEKMCGGAILGSEVNISSNHNTEFSRNIAKLSGGAVCASEAPISVSNNMGDVLFSFNSTNGVGGALSSPKSSVYIIDNHADVVFKDNLAVGELYYSDRLEESHDRIAFSSGGGAILAGKTVSIEGNEKNVLFMNNFSEGFGGAILTGYLVGDDNSSRSISDEGTLVRIAGNKGNVVFSGNSVSISQAPMNSSCGGGAIHTQNLLVTDNLGSVMFYNNVARNGGAIKISEHGTVSVRAKGGDVVFSGNTNGLRESDAIYLAGTSSLIQELSAEKGHSVRIEDAINYESLTLRSSEAQGTSLLDNPTLVFNSKSSGNHLGSVCFSEHTSKIPQVAVLEQGVLSLSNGAQLWLAGFKQQRGSELLLSAGTTFRIMDLRDTPKVHISSSSVDKTGLHAVTIEPKKDGFDPELLLDINTVEIDLSSFVGDTENKQPLPPTIVVPKGTKIGSGSLNLVLVDTGGIGYENHELLNCERNIPLISFQSVSGSSEMPMNDPELEKIDVQVSVPPITSNTYGHSGVWSEAEVVNGRLVIGWKPTGYHLNPEKSGSLVLNTLWGQCGDLRSLKHQQLLHNVTAQRMEFDYSTNLWGAGIGSFINCANICDIDGFTHRSGGYAVGLDTQLIEDFLIGGSFSQFFGYTDSQSYTSRSDQIGYLGSGYIGILAGRWFLKGSLIYSNVQNNLSTRYESLGKSSASWESHGVLADARVDYRYLLNPRKFVSSIVSAFVPFAEVEYIYVDLPEIREVGSESRSFSSGRLQNISVPVGITLEHSYARGQRSEVNSLSLSYALDVYRRQPPVVVSLPTASYSWAGVASDVSRKICRAQFSNDTEWNSYFSTYLGFTYEWREHSVSYDVNGGIRLIF